MTLRPQTQMQLLQRMPFRQIADAFEGASSITEAQLLEQLIRNPELMREVAAATGASPQHFAAAAAKQGNPTARASIDAESARRGDPEVKESAGSRLVEMMQDPLFEEVAEGLIAGSLMVTPMLFQEDKDGRETALQFAGAVAGGIGLGMGGRRIGAHIGKEWHPDEIKSPEIASIARMGGQETISKGVSSSMQSFTDDIAQQFNDRGAWKLRDDLMEMDDSAFQAAYPDLALVGVKPSAVSADDLDKLTTYSKATASDGRMAYDSALDRADNALKSGFSQMTPEERGIAEAAGINGEMFAKLREKPEPVTGEHAGRLVGRVLGDEIGAIGGFALGSLAAGQLGWQSSKDAEIERLKKQLTGV